MGNIAQDKFLLEQQTDNQSLFKAQLSQFIFVDMGQIMGVQKTEAGYRATVRTTRVEYTDPVIYDNVEIMMIGNIRSGISIDPVGAMCIVFGPFSSSYSLEKQAMAGPHRPYHKSYMKCIPIYNPQLWPSCLEFSNDGNMLFKSPYGILAWKTDGGISLCYNNVNYNISIDNEGNIDILTNSFIQHRSVTGEYFLAHFNEEKPTDEMRMKYDIAYFESYREGRYFEAHTNVEVFELEDSEEIIMWDQLLAFDNWRYTKEWKDDTKTVIRKDADGKSLYTFIQNPDGSNSIAQTNADGDPLFYREVNADGEYTMVIGDDLYKLNIDKDGNKTETFEGDYGHTVAGDFGVTVDGDWSVAIGGATTIESTGKMKLYSDAKLIVATAAASLYEILDTLWSDLKGASPATMGSPAAHSWNPAIPIAFTTAATKLGQLLEDP